MYVLKSILFGSAILVITGCSTTANNPNYQQVTKYKGSTPYVNGVAVQQANYNRPVSPTNSQIYAQQQAPAPITYAPQQAGYTTNQQAFNECISKEGNRKLIGAGAGAVVGGLVGRKIGGDKKTLGTVAGAAIGGAAGYGVADKTIRCDQVSAPVVVNQPGQSYPGQVYQGQAYQGQQQTASYNASTAQSTSGILQENTQSLGDRGTPGYYAVNGLTPPSAAPVARPEPQTAQAQTIIPQAVPAPAPFSATLPVSSNHAAFPNALGTIRHHIIAGDTLYSLARTSCSSVSELQSLNNVNSQFYIRAGEEILLPSGRCTR